MQHKNDKNDSGESDCDNYTFNSTLIDKPFVSTPTSIPSNTDVSTRSPFGSPTKARKSNKIRRAASLASPRKSQSSMSPKSPPSKKSKMKLNRQVKIFLFLYYNYNYNVF